MTFKLSDFRSNDRITVALPVVRSGVVLGVPNKRKAKLSVLMDGDTRVTKLDPAAVTSRTRPAPMVLR